MNASKISIVTMLLVSTLAFACGGTDEGKTTDSDGTESGSRRASRNDDDSSDPRDRSSDDDSSSQEQTQECRGSSICINGSCKCESGPQKGKSCCYAPEDEDDEPCAKANECDNVCNSCD